jgi:hypothetical protein
VVHVLGEVHPKVIAPIAAPQFRLNSSCAATLVRGRALKAARALCAEPRGERALWALRPGRASAHRAAVGCAGAVVMGVGVCVRVRVSAC